MVDLWKERGVNIMAIYGATEAGSSLLAMPPRGSDGKSAVGIPVIHAEASIRGADGEPLPDGSIGELWLRGPMLMSGYWNKPAETAAAVGPDGWLRTGDAASRDDDGIFHIVDRWKDMYISGGENVYPAEVENVIYQHPAVVLVSVVGVPDDKWGEAGRAFVVTTADGCTAEELRPVVPRTAGHVQGPGPLRVRGGPAAQRHREDHEEPTQEGAGLMAVSLPTLLQDWYEESWALESVLRPLQPEDWDLPTPAPGWQVRHQVAHLTWTDEALFLALTAPEEFGKLRLRVGTDPEAAVSEAAESGAGAAPEVILRRWVAGQRRTAQALGHIDPAGRIDWFGPPMGAAAAVSARIMETFAHGQDVRDALGLAPVRSPRLRHIAHLAVAARPYSFAVNGLPAPAEDIRVELASDGDTWTWGPGDAGQRVTGDALDFALLATRRRHREDCAVQASGALADQWLDIVQAYAGPPGDGRKPGEHQAPAGPEVGAQA